MFSSTVAAAWAQAVGMAVPAIAAYLIYWGTKANALQEREARRIFIYTALRTNVKRIKKTAAITREFVAQDMRDTGGPAAKWVDAAADGGIIGRQVHSVVAAEESLTSIARKGDESVARFIETCREIIELEVNLGRLDRLDANLSGLAVRAVLTKLEQSLAKQIEECEELLTGVILTTLGKDPAP